MNEEGKGKDGHIEIGPSLSDLPDNILVNILLRLTVKRIFVCKSVCKTWYHLISDPYFAKLHFSQAQFYPLLQSSTSRMLYLVQPEQDDFERMLDMRSPINIKLDCKFKIPHHDTLKIVNSCNGLLCLSNLCDNDHPAIVWNPVTGEFIDLPEVSTISDNSIGCGFGFSPVINQYKVIRMFMCRSEPNRVTRAEVYTLGTQTWRAIPFLPNTTYMESPTYVNGCVYWLPEGLPPYVACFDIEKECFESISLPPLHYYKLIYLDMGVLGGELFISASRCQDVYFWVMKDNSAMKSWSQICCFPVDDDDCLPGSYEPIKYLNNGELLMFNYVENAFICMDTREKGFKYFKVTAGVQPVPHIPSFVPLKHALSGHMVKVLNVKSRCGELKLLEEDKDISIVEEDFEFEKEM